MREFAEPGVYIFDLLTPRACAALLWAFERLPNDAPNTMNKYGKRVTGAAMRTTMAKLMEEVEDIRRSAFPDIAPLKKNPYAFVVDYTPDTQKGLAKHYDSSDVTLNVCLGHEFKGGDLMFYQGHKSYIIPHRIGQAIVHRGSQGHRAMPLKSGRRTNLILWCSARAS